MGICLNDQNLEKMHFLIILILVSACSSCYHTKANDNQIEANASGRKFDILDKRDVMVFLHIQKTGGTTFNRNLIRNIEGHKCEEGKVSKKYFQSRCYRPNSTSTWLFSRYSTGWPCGVHAD